jgi:hypothetical protein
MYSGVTEGPQGIGKRITESIFMAGARVDEFHVPGRTARLGERLAAAVHANRVNVVEEAGRVLAKGVLQNNSQ